MTLKKRTIFLLLIIISMFQFSFAQEKFEQYGIASYYSDAFQGRNTTSGEKYNYTLYTAAHATLPFQTLVKITNLKNNISVVVKINDRCPKFRYRIIDLSRAAAKKLDIISSGIANIKLEIITPSDLNYIENAPDSLFKLISAGTSGMLFFHNIYMTTINRQIIRNFILSKILANNYRNNWKKNINWMAFNYFYFEKLRNYFS